VDTTDRFAAMENASEQTRRPIVRDLTSSAIWRLASIEMLQLLGVYFTHARNEQAQRAVDALFDQVVRRLALLQKLAGHDGSMTIRRLPIGGARTAPKTDYYLSLGSKGFWARAWLAQSEGQGADARRSVRLPALEHTFTCLERLSVAGLSIRFPGASPERIEQLRLAFEIAGHYPAAVESKSDLAFVLHGRPRTVALVRDGNGRPNLNLTLLAGINALSALNAGELVKQADALLALSRSPSGSLPLSKPFDIYNRIVTTPALNSGLLQPLVEAVGGAVPGGDETGEYPSPGPLATKPTAACDWQLEASTAAGALAADHDDDVPGFEQTLHFLYSCLDARDRAGRSALDRLYRADCAKMSAGELFHWLDSAIQTRQMAERDDRSRPLIQRLDAFVEDRLARVPTALWAKVGIRRTSITLDSRGRTLMLGMVPAFISDTVALVRERVLCGRKLAYIASCIDPYQPLDPRMTASLFGVSSQEAEQVTKTAAACFHDPAGLGHRFRVDVTIWNDVCQNALTQILWCHLRGMGRPQSHMAMLGGLRMQLTRLKDPIPMLNFLLTDLTQTTRQLTAADYDALTLSTLLLRGADGQVEIGFTDESALDEAGRLAAGSRQYASWRLEKDQPRMIAKYGLLDEALNDGWNAVCSDCAATAAGFQLLLDLQRETLIFLGLAGGTTAHRLIRHSLQRLLHQLAALNMAAMPLHWRQTWLGQLRLSLRAMGCVGLVQDTALLESVSKQAMRWMGALDPVNREPMIEQMAQQVKNARNAIDARAV
jgi:hypothetical protein